MTVVYIDCVFLLNFVIDYLLLLAAGRLTGEVLRRGRIALGALVGGAYAAMVFLPHMSFLASPLCKVGMAILMVLTAYGGIKRLLRVCLVFFAVSAALGGAIFALELLGGQGLHMHNGIFYSSMDLRLILLAAAGCYVVITFLFQRSAVHTAYRETVPAVLTLGKKRVALTALVDTGNTLTDPVTGRPVMVAEGEKLASLFPAGEAPSSDALRHPVEAMGALDGTQWQGRCRLLPYQAVGVECGLLLALRMDQVKVGKEEYGGILVALSPTRLTDGGGYSALIGA
ncbi:MAG: sigma-E processing peptidase SpoIIGA [Oscillospiraceae bacterium]|nr:sigma-E processing peptidase SpoIIGA [Oscillospiraceae bacterium]